MSIQFDTQRLLSEDSNSEIRFVIKNEELESLLKTYFSKQIDAVGHDTYSLDTETYEDFRNLANSSGFDQDVDFQELADIEEQGSTTSGAGAYQASLHASPKKYKGPEFEQKKSYMQKKWGWKEAPSIPNRKSKMIDYKQLFEREQTKGVDVNGKEVKIGEDIKVLIFKDGTGTITGFDGDQILVTIHKGGGSTFERPNFPLFSKNIEKKEKEDDKKSDKKEDDMIKEIKHEDSVKIIDKDSKYFGRTGKVHDIHDDDTAMIIVDAPGNPTTTINVSKLKQINESYSKFVKETKTRSKSQQFYEATKLVDKKLKEINKILEYTGKLKMDLFEDGHCEDCGRRMNKMMERITKNIAEAYKKTKNIK